MINGEATRRAGDTVDQLVQAARADIVAGRFAPGQRLVARALIDTSGHSRGTVREALRRLAADGLIVLTPNRGASVRQLTRSEMDDLFQLRELLEGLAARLAAERIGQAARRAEFEGVWRSGGCGLGAAFNEANKRFHAAIVSTAGNAHLADLLERMQLPILMMQVQHSMTDLHIAMSAAEHVTIADAILAGDGAAAQAAMQAHMRRSREWVVNLPDAAFAPE